MTPPDDLQDRISVTVNPSNKGKRMVREITNAERQARGRLLGFALSDSVQTEGADGNPIHLVEVQIVLDDDPPPTGRTPTGGAYYRGGGCS